MVVFRFCQVERFCFLYCIRGVDVTNPDPLVNPSAHINLPPVPTYTDQSVATAAAAAAAAALEQSKASAKISSDVSRDTNPSTDNDENPENERRQAMKREQRRMSQERKDQKFREREALAERKASERAVRESSREERRRRKVELREIRERYAQEQKEAALKRAAELVTSNRVPIEITRGAAAARMVAAASVPLYMSSSSKPNMSTSHDKERLNKRSAIVVSTAGDLLQIVTHANNLFLKYSAIAKEHNQKVTWTTVAKELGIHVKVREKYARMHARAEQRGFDWFKNEDWKIKDYPEVRPYLVFIHVLYLPI